VHERSFRRLRADGGSLLCAPNGADKGRILQLRVNYST
jgi:hypothetical protein